MGLSTFFEKTGISEQEAKAVLNRFGNNEALYCRFLKKFLNSDTNMENLRGNLKQGDLEGIMLSSHTIKGLSGNLGLLKLYEITSNIVSAIRSGETKETVNSLAEAALKEYDRIVELIAQLE